MLNFFLLKQNVLFEASQTESEFSTYLFTKNKSEDHCDQISVSDISLAKSPLSGMDGSIAVFLCTVINAELGFIAASLLGIPWLLQQQL